jgi:hypothetical protein
MAGCQTQGFLMSLCDGCSYEWQMNVEKNTPCAHNVRNPGNVAFESFRVARPARHGVAGMRTGGFAYSPPKDFSGQDDFAFEIRFRDRGNQLGTVRFNVAVTVR